MGKANDTTTLLNAPVLRGGMRARPFLLWTLVVFILVAPGLPAQEEHHMTLLAVSETEDGLVGGTADLYLEIRPGTGRIFMETFPFTKVDTQMSTRFANEIACDYIDADCDDYDFFYTLRAGSSILAGPSAGSSIAVLTIAALKGWEVDDSLAVTGTINSGGFIGPVGGLEEKVEAASREGLQGVLVPFGESLSRERNRSVLPENATYQPNITVTEVATLDEAVEAFTGRQVKEDRAISLDNSYSETMRGLASILCDRTASLKTSLNETAPAINASRLSQAVNLTGQGEQAFANATYYSAASFCYGANVEYSRLLLEEQNLSARDIMEHHTRLRERIRDFESDIEAKEIRTITDLESYMVTKERLDEAIEHLDELTKANDTEQKITRLALAGERLNSAYSWFTFFGKEGREFTFDEPALQSSCTIKIAEVEERLQYVSQYFPQQMADLGEELEEAKADSLRGDYALCLFKASRTKASVGMVMSVLGVRPDDYGEVLDIKLNIVRNMIAEQTEQDIFPILGYSYYEYASSLQEKNQLSALLYAEYALELGNLDMYFKDKETFQIGDYINYELAGIFAGGILVGLIASIGFRRRAKRGGLTINIKS